MIINDQLVEITVKHNRILNYYVSKGYECVLREPFTVKVLDLRPAARVKVDVVCDYCGSIYKMEYRRYCIDVLGGTITKCACRKCAPLKVQESVFKVYGVRSTICVESVRAKQEATCIERYGSKCPIQNEAVRTKAAKTCAERYGDEIPAWAPSVRQKRIETNIKKYGVPHASSSPLVQQKRVKHFVQTYGVENPFELADVKEKIKRTNQIKYGVAHTMQSDYIRDKARRTMYEHQLVPTSKEQRRLCSLYGGTLNFPIGRYSVDIMLGGLAIEYNGGGHSLGVKFGQMTIDEFRHKESVRMDYILKNGYKMMIIDNPNDTVYSDMEYLHWLELSKEALTSSCSSWVRLDLERLIIITQEETICLTPSQVAIEEGNITG